MPKTKQIIDSWEEEFDKLWNQEFPKYKNLNGDFKQLISSLLTQAIQEERKRIIKRIQSEHVSMNYNSSWHRENARGYNEGLEDAIRIVNE